AGHDDAGLVGVLAGRHGGIDRHDDADEIGNILVRRPAQLLDESAGPKGARHVVEYFSVQLLATKPRALVFLDDLMQEGWCQIGPVFVSRAPRYGDTTAFAGEQF